MISDTDVADIFAAMQRETLDGMTLADVIGGGDPLDVARHFMGLLQSHAGLVSSDWVLDVGCGCGRIAALLTGQITPPGCYCGIDIVPGLVDFARRHITARHPHFRFLTLAGSNATYDRFATTGGQPDIASLDDACAPGTIGLYLATSLYTHLDGVQAADNLRAVRRALAPDGRAFVTFFLLDEATRRLLAPGRSVFQFAHPHGEGVWIENPQQPAAVVGFELAALLRLVADAGLYVERILYGNWAGRAHHVSFQDILVLRRVSA
jgi:SAM-dependent methyltransferase